MSEADKMACQRKCWQIAAAGGVLLWLFLAFALDYPALKALIIAVILAVAGAYVLRWAVCAAATKDTAKQWQPAPEPAPQPKSEPVAPPPAAQAVTESAAAPVVLSAVTPRPDPTPFAAMPAEEPAKPAVRSDPAKPKAAAKPKAPAKPKAAAPKKAKPATGAARAAGLDAAMGRTKEASSEETVLLSRPRGGKGDDLKLIVGVGPKLEKLLNDIGVWHFDQIASWKARDIALVDSKMATFKGRITRDGWVKQARVLAKGEA